ncbi:assimilatory nitrite reductase [NAD(P)H] small subunit [bacterium BMS3Bbin12]|nr:assimilatory nitrite reductase [NAD(P)H] small subunit [bacterium BMS3Abin12]GBE48777.1 assimilatory nitrite reductase [NAD(P)H] small subunit [bacterium BMS3Bbin12]GBE49659.1 assimilatory nitrite reductase [NAD(P)H] small subunit [bacterium BMS3Bbin13]
MNDQASPRAPADSKWLRVGPLEAIPPRGARVVHSRAGDIAVFRTGDDRVFALLDRCPHKGGPLSQGIVFDNRVACPLHNWVIDLEAGAACAPDEGQVQRFPVRVAEGTVYLCLQDSYANGEALI